MFKWKTILPERPPLPTGDEILEDLNVASQGDIVFQSSEESPNPIIPARVSAESMTKPFSEESTELESRFQTYEMIHSFVEKMNLLEKQILIINEQLQCLKSQEESLNENITSIRNKIDSRDAASSS